MNTTIHIVTSDFYSGESLAQAVEEAFGDAVCIHATYRVYQLPLLQPGDIVLSDGTCKDRHDDGYSYPVQFDIRQHAEKSGAAFVFFGFKPISMLDRLLRPRSARRIVGTDNIIAAARTHLS